MRSALAEALHELDDSFNNPAADRQEILTAAFVELAELAQGAVDAEFALRGCDAASPESAFWAELLVQLGSSLAASSEAGDPPVFPAARWLRRAEALPALSGPVACKCAEGYAFYALYPEAYLQAARRLRGVGPLSVVGIRSIGFGLAALVSAGSGAGPPLSVRPVGHPFARELKLDAALDAQFADPTRHYAIVDEGPGLSGSSFGAVVDRLEAAAVPDLNIHLFPSHRGEPGSAASAAQRERWRKLDRRVVEFDDLFLGPANAERGPARWFEDVAGPGALEDVSAGGWRRHLFASDAHWPAVNMQQERRKFLLRGTRKTLLLKFAGLGRYGAEKTGRAIRLAAAGFTPAFVALRRGFSAELWQEGARPMRAEEWPAEERLARLAEYLGWRARHFPASRGDGASLSELAEMLVFNAQAHLGKVTGLERFAGMAEGLQARVAPVFTDNRMRAWEWLRLRDGRVLKTDAVDHSVGHDLVGAQDVAWDVAAAVAEFGLEGAETAELCRRIALSGSGVDSGLLDFLRPAYLAFELGAASMARDAMAGMPDEAAGLDREVARYEHLLRRELARLL